MKLRKLLIACVGMSMAFAASAAGNVPEFSQARVYINPGHGGWTANDRPMATINYAQMDTMGFFETNTDLTKGLTLRNVLQKAGVGFIKMSRTKNGYVSEGDKNKTPNDQIETAPSNDGNQQVVTLSVICQDVESNNMDYFISIHSNAASEGSVSNYPLLLYRGTDDASGNGLVNAKAMAQDAWKYVAKNGVTYHSAYTAATSNNSRGDITFYGSSSTNGLGYTGYLGVLKHGCDGFLSEGCFHTYQPERQRLLNKDYCRQEGVRYSRAIRAWFGDNSETKGYIMGTVKDKNNTLEHNLYNYKPNTVDAYNPLNNVTVVLQDKDGNKVGEYTTDKEYNGLFVFSDLTPGTYKLVYDIPGFWPETEEIEVVANETAFTNKRLTDTSHEKPSEEEIIPEVEDYPHPVQDGDIAAASSYKFMKESNLESIEALKDLKIRRAILRDGKYYVLAVDAEKAPKLLVIDPVTGSLVKEMSTAGIKTEGFNGKKYPYVLSDIAFTMDGVLLGTNSTVIGRENNGYQTGDFYMYKWQAAEGGALEDATPEVLLTLPTNTSESLAAAGNNYSNFIANTIAISGTSKEFKFYFDSHAGDAWNTDYGVKYVCWIVKDGKVSATQHNATIYEENQFGEDAQMTLSPLAIDRIIVDGSAIAPKEFGISWETNDAVEYGSFSGDIPVESYGSNYFRYADKIYMSAPVCEKQGETYSYKSYLFDVTGGLDKAENIGVTDAVITGVASPSYMTGAGVVDNADINMYLLAGGQFVKYTTKGVEQDPSPARIFAYNLKSEMNGNNYNVTFELNEDATSVDLILTGAASGEVVKTINLGAKSKGLNDVTVASSDIPANATCNWSIRATAGNVTRLTKLSDDKAIYKYDAPNGVAIDKSPESKYFGRVYVTNTTGATTTGLYVLEPNQSEVSSVHNGGISWTGVSGEGPRKVAVAEDGRVFLCDASASNAGIYVMNPEDFTMSPLFEGATNEAGVLSIGGTYVGGQTVAIGVRGSGENTQLYAIDKNAPGSSAWKKFTNTYNIGTSSKWTAAPTSSKAASSYVGNDNASIVPVSTGFWAAQYRGAGSGNNSGTPSMFYYSDRYSDAVFNSAETNLIESSQNGGLAVNEKESLVAVSDNNGLSVFTYKMNAEGMPVVTKKFHTVLEGPSAGYDDFEFDYAGNLYAISKSGKALSVWAMPTENNVCTTPAPKTMTMSGTSGVEASEVPAARMYPNPVTDILKVEAAEIINTVDVYNLAGALVAKKANVNAMSTTIDLNDLVRGIYFVKVNNGNAVKVIKK